MIPDPWPDDPGALLTDLDPSLDYPPADKETPMSEDPGFPPDPGAGPVLMAAVMMAPAGPLRGSGAPGSPSRVSADTPGRPGGSQSRDSVRGRP